MSARLVTALGFRIARRWRTLFVLVLVWCLLWADFRPGTLIGGALVAVFVVLVFPLPPMGLTVRPRPWPLAVLVLRFAGDLMVASLQVAWIAVAPRSRPRGGIVAVPLRPAPEVLLVAVAELSSLVPGSLVVEIDMERRVLYLHVLDLKRSGGPEGVRKATQLLEQRVLRAFGSESAGVSAEARAGEAAGEPASEATGELAGDPAASEEVPR